MSIFDAPDFKGHEQVVFFSDQDTGLRAIVAIHNTNLGPALGGVRMQPYASEDEALRDVLRLSRGMTYKAATLNVMLGGGKSVIIGDPRKDKTPALLHAFGRCVSLLNDRYIVGEDIGTNPSDMKEIRLHTHCVTCLREEDGGYGDPAKFTALGVFSAMRAGLQQALGSADFSGRRVAVQGVGNVGFNLCKLLGEVGAELIIADVVKENLERTKSALNFTEAEPDAIYDAQADVFAPCAVGAILNDDTIPRLKARVVAGAANNQLDDEFKHARMLAERDIVYLPDYVANGGGLIACTAEWYRTDINDVPDKVRGIFDTCRAILDEAGNDGVTTTQAANQIAERRFMAGKAARG